MQTIEQLRRAAQRRKEHAERTLDSTKRHVLDICARARADGRDHLTEAEDQLVERIEFHQAKARDEAADADRLLAELDAAAAEDQLHAQRMAERHPTRASGTGAGYTSPRSAGAGQEAASDSVRWVRHADGRPAVVERGQRMADHPVTAGLAEQTRSRDEHIIGMHGGLGSLLRSISTTSGSAVVPTVWAADIIDLARNYAAVMQAGAEVVPMDAKIVQIGRLTADPSASFRTEGSAITASDPTFDNVTLTAVTLNCLVIGSLEWFQDTTPGGGADQLVAEAIARKIAVTLDLAALFGQVTAGGEQTATGNNMLPSGGLPTPYPRGILANLLANASSSVLGGAANGTVQTAASFWNEVIDTVMTPLDFNERPNAMLWPSHLARRYAEAYDTQNNPMRVPPVVDGIAKFVTNQIPSGFGQGTGTLMADVFAGDFTQLIIGQRLDLTIQTLTEAYAPNGQIGLLATWRGDIQLARPRAFCVYRYLQGK
jgi:HK97 family phage major capsid protein